MGGPRLPRSTRIPPVCSLDHEVGRHLRSEDLMRDRPRHNYEVFALLLLALTVAVPDMAWAQTSSTVECSTEECSSADNSGRAGLSLMGELGNPPALSVSVEHYFADERFSAVGSVGYIPDGWRDSGVSGPTASVGARIYMGPNDRYRGFLQLGVTELSSDRRVFSESEEAPSGSEGQQSYGPAAHAGARVTARGGFTFIVIVGVGVGFPDGFLAYSTRYGIGYTWP